MYVCMCVYICVCICVCICVYVHIRVCVYVCVCVYSLFILSNCFTQLREAGKSDTHWAGQQTGVDVVALNLESLGQVNRLKT